MHPSNKPWYERPVFIIIGIIAAFLTIFSFTTGLTSLEDMFSSAQTQPSQDFPTKNPENTITQEPLLEPTNTAQPTSTPVPIPIKNYETATVSMIDWVESTENGKVRVQWLSAGNIPLEDFDVTIAEVTTDITGKPVALWKTNLPGGETDFNGVVEISDIAPGTYALMLHNGGHSALGAWGEQGEVRSNGKEMIIFPIEAGKQTQIEIYLSLLEVEVWNRDGTNVFKDIDLYLMCEDQDISGNLIPADRCNGEVLWEYDYPTGVAQFHVGPGTYFIRPRHFWEVGDPVYAKGIVVGINQQVRTSINLPFD